MRPAPSPFVKNSDDNLLNPFAISRVSNGTADAKARTMTKVCQVGDGQGNVQVKARKGWFFGRLPQPDGATLIMFFAPSDETGQPLDPNLKDGQAIFIKPIHDGQPVEYRYDGTSTSYNGWQLTSTIPCGTNPDGTYRLPSLQTTYWPASGSAPTSDPTNPFNGVSIVGGLPDTTKYKSSPLYASSPPANPTAGDLWQDSGTGVVYKRYGDNLTGNWFPVTGPYSGTFVLRQIANTATAGTVMYQMTTSGGADIANNTDLTNVPGRVLGLLLVNTSASNYGVIQSSGDFKLTNSFTPGTPLYFDASGQLTTTCPAANSGAIAQRIGTAKDGNFINIVLGPCLVRSL